MTLEAEREDATELELADAAHNHHSWLSGKIKEAGF